MKLKIGAHQIIVKYEDLNGEKLGEFNRTDNSITIHPALSQSQKDSTLIHEIMHVLNSEVNHTYIDGLSEQFLQVLTDNKLWISPHTPKKSKRSSKKKSR